MEIIVGGFYMARVRMTFPQKKLVTRHVEIVRVLDGNQWEAINTHKPSERYVVTKDQLTPESDEMRASREASWSRYGRPT